MSIDVEWQDENGAALSRYNGPPVDPEFVGNAPPDAKCMCFIDPYGDTTFNAAQVSALESELESIVKKNESGSHQARALLYFVASLEDRVHRYLKFIGD